MSRGVLEKIYYGVSSEGNGYLMINSQGEGEEYGEQR